MNLSKVLRLKLKRALRGDYFRNSPDRVFILPTRIGLFFGMGLGLVFMLAASYDNNFAYLLLFMLTFLFLIAMVMTHNNIKAVQVSQISSTPGEVHKDIPAKLYIKNISAEGAYELKCSGQTEQDKLEESILKFIKPFDSKLLPVHLRVSQPGVYKVQRITLSSIYPLGLFVAWKYFYPEHGELYAYPRPRNYISSPTLQEQKISIENHQTVMALANSGDEMKDYRPYRVGDTLNRIHWPLHFRGGSLMIKNFTSEEPPTVVWIEKDLLAQLGQPRAYEQLVYVLLESRRRYLPLHIKFSEEETSVLETHYQQENALKKIASRFKVEEPL